MSSRTSPDLGQDYQTLIADSLASGRYDSADDVLRAGLDLLRERESRLQALHEAIDAGVASGPARAFDFDEFKARMQTKYAHLDD